MVVLPTSLSAGVAANAFVGRCRLRQVVYQTAAAGRLDMYDAANATLTQSDPSYTNLTRTNGYSRTATGRDMRDSSFTYNYGGSGIGVGDASNTVAANATRALLIFEALLNAAAGQSAVDVNAQITRGITLKSDVAATVLLTYDPE